MDTTIPNGQAVSANPVGISMSKEPEVKKEEQRGSTISFHDIEYQVEVKVKRKKTTKCILKDITGVFQPGMNAILGPTGSGKTSLLDILARRKDPRGLTGTVLVDGAQQPSNFKCVTGYVVQDDVVMGTLTVRENFAFSAALRLHDNVSHKERKKRVDDVITELGLTECANTRVGTEFIRGVSGGERKRTNIGMELITKPTVLFLDEPTTGLDAGTACAVMQILSCLSKRGRTIIFSIHQPRFSIYRLFDKLHLLSKGETVYHGPADGALDYFKYIGFECEEHNNPPDFFLDVINGYIESSPSADALSLAPLLDENDKHHTNKSTQVDLSEMDEIKKPNAALPDLFKQSEAYTTVTRDANEIYSAHTNGEEDVVVPSFHYAASFLTQMKYVCKRTLVNVLRNPQLLIFQPLTVIILAVLLGLVYWRLDTSLNSGIQNRVGVFLFVIMNLVFNNMSAIEIFIKEKVIFIHESASGFYRVSTFFFSKILCDLIPMRFIPTLLFSLITYWMLGLKSEIGAFFMYMLTLQLTSFAACGLAFVISCSVNLYSVATIFISMAYVIMLVFSGLLVNISSLPSWLQWLQYLSIFRYSLNGLSINELVGLTFTGVDNRTMDMTGETYLEAQGIDYSAWGLWQNELALVLICLGFLIITYIKLRLIPKYK